MVPRVTRSRPSAGRLLSALVPILMWPAVALAQDVTGDWHGIMDVGAVGLGFTLHVSAADSGYTATMDVPDQGALGLPVEFSVANGTVTWAFAAAGVKYEGVVDPGVHEDHRHVQRREGRASTSSSAARCWPGAAREQRVGSAND